MHTAIRLATTTSVLAVLLQAFPATPIAVEPSLTPAETSHTYSFRSESDATLTQWALARFQRAGLQLPPLAIAFHDVKQPCDGHPGFYRSGTPAHIDICGFAWNQSPTAPKKTILHELAHAWDRHNLTEDIRLRFLRFRGLDTWGDEQTPWEEQGFEHAAEVIAWALMDRELDMVTIRDADPTTLAQAYELLTSTPPPVWGRMPVTLIGAVSPEDQSLVDWAVGLFQEAGLVLPNIEIVFDSTGKACEGASGRFTDNGEEMRVALSAPAKKD